MHDTKIRIETEVTLFTNDAGDTIGHMVAVPRTMTGLAADRIVYVGFAHDWDGESDVRFGDEYDPICVDTSDDPEQVRNEVERRDREAQAPEGHTMTTYFVDPDASGEPTLWRSTGTEDDFPVALFDKRELDAKDPILWPTLTAAIPKMSADSASASLVPIIKATGAIDGTIAAIREYRHEMHQLSHHVGLREARDFVWSTLGVTSNQPAGAHLTDPTKED
jgi:hypothetical protein